MKVVSSRATPTEIEVFGIAVKHSLVTLSMMLRGLSGIDSWHPRRLESSMMRLLAHRSVVREKDP